MPLTLSRLTPHSRERESTSLLVYSVEDKPKKKIISHRDVNIAKSTEFRRSQELPCVVQHQTEHSALQNGPQRWENSYLLPARVTSREFIQQASETSPTDGRLRDGGYPSMPFFPNSSWVSLFLNLQSNLNSSYFF